LIRREPAPAVAAAALPAEPRTEPVAEDALPAPVEGPTGEALFLPATEGEAARA
jgi:hypothetical protein